MRVDDIMPAKQLPAGFVTSDVYLPKDKRISDLTFEEAKRGLCHKAGGDPHACATCPAPCGIGKRLVELLNERDGGAL